MFGLTTTRRLRAAQHELELEAAARWTAESNLAAATDNLHAANHGFINSCNQLINERAQAERDHGHYRDRLTRALRACARYRTQIPRARPVDGPDELWSLIDWSLWGSGMGDAFRERLADQFLAAITPEQHDTALRLIDAWTNSGRLPLGRRRYEDQQARLHRALHAVARHRADAARERRTVTRLAEQLLGTSPVDHFAPLDDAPAEVREATP
ncbi:hypothetical protein [Streptomyces liangshanensis]|uniref:hypothetical protein n=1 Tax=Streptomyces liangshanensis TaxID=2717324 RepID=UPI0036D98B74